GPDARNAVGRDLDDRVVALAQVEQAHRNQPNRSQSDQHAEPQGHTLAPPGDGLQANPDPPEFLCLCLNLFLLRQQNSHTLLRRFLRTFLCPYNAERGCSPASPTLRRSAILTER